MFKQFNNGMLFLNHDNITSVEVTPSSNPKAVNISTTDGRIHSIAVPDESNAKDYALELVTAINRGKFDFGEENIVRKVSV